MTDEANQRSKDLFHITTPYPYLVSAMDQYYGYRNQATKKMRILITTFWEYPVVGGLQNYMTTLKHGLELLGHHVDIIAPNQFSDHKFVQSHKKIKKKLKTFFIDRYGCYSDKILDSSVSLNRYEYMLNRMDLSSYDIFHAQDRFTANILGRLNKFYQKPLFFTPHGFMTLRKLKNKLIEKGSVDEAYYLQIDRKAIENSDKVIMLCEAFRQPLKDLGAKDSKLTTVLTGIDFHALKKKNKKAKDKVVITCISRLGPRKGHKYLIEALSLIEKESAHVEVLIVGDGEMRKELENQVQALALSNVRFLGTRTDVPELLRTSDIYVLPTVSDTLPISIIEAMFGQQAIITTNCGGIPEIIENNQTGLIVEPANSKDLAEKLLLLIKDVTLRETLARQAREFAETHLTASNMARSIEQEYLSLL